MVLLGDEAQQDARFGLFGHSANLDSCMVCAKCTIGLEIILDAPDVPLADEAQVDARFGPFRDSANLDVR
jgi:hypothetical protein